MENCKCRSEIQCQTRTNREAINQTTFKIHVYTAQFLFNIRLDFEELLKD